MRRPASADPRRKRTLANIKMRRAAGDALVLCRFSLRLVFLYCPTSLDGFSHGVK
jgi:hypothetical protein